MFVVKSTERRIKKINLAYYLNKDTFDEKVSIKIKYQNKKPINSYYPGSTNKVENLSHSGTRFAK